MKYIGYTIMAVVGVAMFIFYIIIAMAVHDSNQKQDSNKKDCR